MLDVGRYDSYESALDDIGKDRLIYINSLRILIFFEEVDTFF